MSDHKKQYVIKLIDGVSISCSSYGSDGTFVNFTDITGVIYQVPLTSILYIKEV